MRQSHYVHGAFEEQRLRSAPRSEARFPLLLRETITAKLLNTADILNQQLKEMGSINYRRSGSFSLMHFHLTTVHGDSCPGQKRPSQQGDVGAAGVPPYLGLALRGEVLLDEQGPQSHSEVLVGLCEAEPAQVQLLLGAVDLPGELVDGAAERRGQVLAEGRHDAPQHVVVENPKENTARYS